MTTRRNDAGPEPARTPRSNPAVRGQPQTHHTAPPRHTQADEEHPHYQHALPGEDLTGETSSRAVTIGWITAGTFLVVGLIVVYLVVGKHTREREAQETYAAALKHVTTTLSTLDLSKEPDARRALTFIEEQEKTWKRSTIEAEVLDYQRRANVSLEKIKEHKSFWDRLTAVEAKVATASALTADDMQGALRELTELERKADDVGTDFKQRLVASRKQLVRFFGDKLISDAKIAAGQAATDWRGASIALARAEDKLIDLEQLALKDQDRDLAKSFAQARVGVIEDSDKALEPVFTADFIEKVGWRDLISADMAKEWISGGAIEWRIQDGKMVLTGPTGEGAKPGIVSSKQQWRDFALDIELTVEKGKVQFFLRVQDRADQQVVQMVDIGENAKIPVSGNKPATATITLIGSKCVTKVGDQALEEELSKRKSRRGSIGIVASKNAVATITRFKIRELR
jgi:hypothetical protein